MILYEFEHDMQKEYPFAYLNQRYQHHLTSQSIVINVHVFIVLEKNGMNTSMTNVLFYILYEKVNVMG